MAEVVHIGNTTSAFLVEKPDVPTTTAVVFLPGISGGALSERFQPVVDACLAAGYAIARVSAWENAEDIGQKNLSDIYRDLGEVTAYLHQQGYTQIFGIGKSFGGALMLTLPSVYITKKVLWAPAIGVSESSSNIDAYMSAALGSLKSSLDLSVDREYLSSQETPVLVIHGTADNVVPFSNSERIVSLLRHARLVSVEGADHSYTSKEHETLVIKETIDFLNT